MERRRRGQGRGVVGEGGRHILMAIATIAVRVEEGLLKLLMLLKLLLMMMVMVVARGRRGQAQLIVISSSCCFSTPVVLAAAVGRQIDLELVVVVVGAIVVLVLVLHLELQPPWSIAAAIELAPFFLLLPMALFEMLVRILLVRVPVRRLLLLLFSIVKTIFVMFQFQSSSWREGLHSLS